MIQQNRLSSMNDVIPWDALQTPADVYDWTKANIPMFNYLEPYEYGATLYLEPEHGRKCFYTDCCSSSKDLLEQVRLWVKP